MALSVCGMAKQGGRLFDVVKLLRLSCYVACMQGRMLEKKLFLNLDHQNI